MQGKLLWPQLICNLHGQCVWSPSMWVWFSVTNLVRWRLWELHFFSHIFGPKHFQKCQRVCKDCNPSGQLLFSIPAPSLRSLQGGKNPLGMAAVLIFPLESLKSIKWQLSLWAFQQWHLAVAENFYGRLLYMTLQNSATQAWYLLADAS